MCLNMRQWSIMKCFGQVSEYWAFHDLNCNGWCGVTLIWNYFLVAFQNICFSWSCTFDPILYPIFCEVVLCFLFIFSFLRIPQIILLLGSHCLVILLFSCYQCWTFNSFYRALQLCVAIFGSSHWAASMNIYDWWMHLVPILSILYLMSCVAMESIRSLGFSISTCALFSCL